MKEESRWGRAKGWSGFARVTVVGVKNMVKWSGLIATWASSDVRYHPNWTFILFISSAIFATTHAIDLCEYRFTFVHGNLRCTWSRMSIRVHMESGKKSLFRSKAVYGKTVRDGAKMNGTIFVEHKICQKKLFGKIFVVMVVSSRERIKQRRGWASWIQ